jgi:hypothetical protein
MLSALLAPMGLGLVLGLRHAFEADHLAAVATIVTRHKSPLRAGALGAFWGTGHLTSLLLVGLPILVLGWRFPRGLEVPLELGIAGMIVALGIGGLASGVRNVREPGGARPFWIGAAHGLAGSGALTLLILGTMSSRREGLLYLGSFGLGSTLGMAAASVALTLPVAISGTGAPRLARAVSAASVLFGLFYGGTILAGAFGIHRFS